MLLLVIIIFISSTFQAHSSPFLFLLLLFLSPLRFLLLLPFPFLMFHLLTLIFFLLLLLLFLFLIAPSHSPLPVLVDHFPVPTPPLASHPIYARPAPLFFTPAFPLLLLLHFLLQLEFCCFSYCPLPVFLLFLLPFPPFFAPPLLKQYNQVNHRINCIHLGTPTEKRLSVIQKVADCLLDQQSVTIGECIGKGRESKFRHQNSHCYS